MAVSYLKPKLKKLPKKARRAFRVKSTHHNIVAIPNPTDEGYLVYTYRTAFEIEYNGEIIYRGWRDAGRNSRLQKISIVDDSMQNAVHKFEVDLDNPPNDLITTTIDWGIKPVYECQNK